MTSIQLLRTKLEQKKGWQARAVSHIQKTEDEIKNITQQLRFAEKAQAIIQTVAKQTQQELEYHISEIVTLAFQSIFPNPYEFQLEFVIQRNKTEALIWFIRGGERAKPKDACGGGVVDIASFALRIALWALKQPKSRNTLILDEPFKNLSANLQPKASQLLQELSKKLNLQIIMVTHCQELIGAADKTFEVTWKDGISQVRGIE